MNTTCINIEQQGAVHRTKLPQLAAPRRSQARNTAVQSTQDTL